MKDLLPSHISNRACDKARIWKCEQVIYKVGMQVFTETFLPVCYRKDLLLCVVSSNFHYEILGGKAHRMTVIARTSAGEV